MSVSLRIPAMSKAVRLGGYFLCWSRMFTSTAPMCTWASVRPGISVMPEQSISAS